MKKLIFPAFLIILLNSCDIIDNCKEFDNYQTGFYIVNTQSNDFSFFPFNEHDSFLSDVKLFVTKDEKVWATSVYSNYLIDPKKGTVELEIWKDEPVLTLPTLNNLFFSENKYGRFNYNEDLSTSSLIDSSFIFSINQENGNIDTLFKQGFQFIEPNKLIVRSIYLPVQSFIDDNEGMMAILDEETKILSTDSLKTVLSVDQFYFERNLVLIKEGGRVIEKIIPLSNKLEQYVSFESPTISVTGKNMAFENSNSTVTVINIDKKEFEVYKGRQPVLSPNGKYLAVKEGYQVKVYDLQISKEINIENLFLGTWSSTPNFTLDSRYLLITDLTAQDNIQYGIVWEQNMYPSNTYFKQISDTRDFIKEKDLDRMSTSISQAIQLNKDEVFFFVNVEVNRWCD